jgi:hypothetical protein
MMVVGFINIGATPCEESCAQVGQPNYRKQALRECHRFIKLLRKKCGPEPEGAWLGIKWFPHDFGEYCEVVCYYTGIKGLLDYALRCESEAPATWEENE